MEISTSAITTAFAAGIISFLSPCVLPLVPGYVSYITGQSVARSTMPKALIMRFQATALSVCFALGFTTIFVILGASATALGQALVSYRYELNLVGGAIVIGFGLFTLGLLRPSWLQHDLRIDVAFPGGRPLAAYLLGAAFAFGWSPCVGPILGSILSLAGTAETVGTGVALLGAYSAGLAAPFLLSSLAVGAFLATFRRFRGWLPTVERAAGVMLVVVGVLVITNYFIVLNSYALSLTPAWLLRRL